jgi:thiopurine S-methyltransferase
MHQDFWQARWASNQIGFHLMEVNPQLVRHQDVLSGARRVLVPLCGKSLDLAWLAGLGYAVQGVELAERAVIDFFREQQIEPGIRERDGFRIYSAGALELWCGDFFDLQAQHLRAAAVFTTARR